MPLRFALKVTSSVPLEVEGITPDSVRGKSLAEIERLVIFQGNVKLPLAEFFAVSGDGADEIHDWEGDLAGVHWIGAKMTAGRIVIHASGGRHIGSEMRGGQIHVLGDAGDWVGGEMHGFSPSIEMHRQLQVKLNCCRFRRINYTLLQPNIDSRN